MLDKFKKMQIESLDKSFKKINIQAISNSKPNSGWIRSIREALCMPLLFPASKLSISVQGVRNLEQNEIDESITLKSLRNLAEALDCELHYAIIPRGKSLNKIIKKRARQKAKEIVRSVDDSMSLENQKIKNSNVSVKELEKDLYDNLNKDLWN